MGIPVMDQLLKDIEASDRREKKNKNNQTPTRSQILLLLSTQGISCTKDQLALCIGHVHPCDGNYISKAFTLQILLN